MFKRFSLIMDILLGANHTIAAFQDPTLRAESFNAAYG